MAKEINICEKKENKIRNQTQTIKTKKVCLCVWCGVSNRKFQSVKVLPMNYDNLSVIIKIHLLEEENGLPQYVL